MKLTAFSCVFAALSISAMSFFMISGSTVVLGSSRKAGVFNVVNDGYNEASSLMNREDDRLGFVTVPLPESVVEEDITVEKDTYGRAAAISIKNVPEDYYHKNLFSGDMANIKSIRYGYEDGVARIVLGAEDIFEPFTELDNHRLYLKLVPPHEIYSHVVVIDPGHGGENQGSSVYGIKENDIVDGVVEKLRKIEISDDIGVYYTREIGQGAETEQRLEIARSVSADLLVSIHTNADSMSRTTTGCGTAAVSANKAVGELFGSKLADLTELQYAGVQDGSKMNILKDADMPAVLVELGYITNKKEALEMTGEDYQKAAAESIAESIREYFEDGQKN